MSRRKLAESGKEINLGHYVISHIITVNFMSATLKFILVFFAGAGLAILVLNHNGPDASVFDMPAKPVILYTCNGGVTDSSICMIRPGDSEPEVLLSPQLSNVGSLPVLTNKGEVFYACEDRFRSRMNVCKVSQDGSGLKILPVSAGDILFLDANDSGTLAYVCSERYSSERHICLSDRGLIQELEYQIRYPIELKINNNGVVAFTCFDRESETPHICTIAADSTSAKKIAIHTSESDDLDLNDSDEIVYLCLDGEFEQICKINADGTGKEQLTSGSPRKSNPTIDRHGNMAFSCSDRICIRHNETKDYYDNVELLAPGIIRVMDVRGKGPYISDDGYIYFTCPDENNLIHICSVNVGLGLSLKMHFRIPLSYESWESSSSGKYMSVNEFGKYALMCEHNIVCIGNSHTAPPVTLHYQFMSFSHQNANKNGDLVFNCTEDFDLGAHTSMCLMNLEDRKIWPLTPSPFSMLAEGFSGPEINGNGDIAYVCQSQSGFSLCVIDNKGTILTRFEEIQVDFRNARFDHDMNDFGTIVFQCMRGEDLNKICKINSDGTGYHEFSNSSIETMLNPSINNSGTIAFWCDSYLCTMKSDGSNLKRLRNDIVSQSNDMNNRGQIVYMCGADFRQSQICIVNSDGSGHKQLTRSRTRNHSPIISDGGWVVYYCDDEFCMVKADGSGFIQLTNDGDQKVYPSIYEAAE